MLQLTRQSGKLSVVDPKGRSFARYAGANILTPNRSELAEVVGGWESDEEMNGKAESVRADLDLDALLLTMSEQGLRLFREGDRLHRTAQAKEVYDVSGAGDTVVAALAVARGIGEPWERAIDFANAAAGIVVSRLGTSVATLDEVLEKRAELVEQ